MAIQELGRDAFLNLLTTQLKFQDPGKPMDSTAFVTQLAQFRALESADQTNKQLTALLNGTTAMNNMSAATLIGKRVEVPGANLSHRYDAQGNGQENIAYQLAEYSEEVAINIVNNKQQIVNTLFVNDSQTKGTNQVVWNGKDSQGNKVPEGIYSYIGAAKYADGKWMPIKIMGEGLVSGVSYGDGGPFVTVNGASVPVADIIKVSK